MNRKLILIIVASIAIILILGVTLIGFVIIPPRDVNDYGTVTVHSLYGGDGSSLGPALSSGDTIIAEDGLAVVWRPDPDYSGELTCQLYSVAGVWYEDGNWNLNTVVDPYFHLWGFLLEGVPQGTTDFYCAFGGMYTEDISWVGSTIHFNIYSSTVPEDTIIEFTEEPEDTSGAGGELITLRWWLVCEGTATGTITVDGAAETPRTITPSSSPQSFTYTFSESDIGTYIVKLTIDPEYGDTVSSSCEVEVTSTETTTTTDTTTTDTTTDTTTTTTEPPPDEYDAGFLFVCVGIGIVVVVAIVLKVAK